MAEGTGLDQHFGGGFQDQVRLAAPTDSHPVSNSACRVPFTVDHEYKRSFFYGTGRGTGFTEGTPKAFFLRKSGAGDGIRTRNPQLGKLMRYRCATPAQEVKRR